MAFLGKANRLFTLNLDIVIVQECECPDKLKFGLFDPKPNDVFWYGDNPNKGLGVFSYSDYRI